MVRGSSLSQLARDDRPRFAGSAMRRLLAYLHPHLKEATWAVPLLMIASIAGAANPALTGLVIDAAIVAAAEGRDARALVVPGGMLIAAVIVGWWALRAHILLFGSAGQHALSRLRADLFDRLQRVSVSYFESVDSGDLMSRLVNDVETLNSFLSQGLRRALASSFAVVATIVGMMAVDWRLATVTLFAIPAMIGVTSFFGTVARGAFRKRQEAIGDVSSTLAEEIAGIRVAQAFNRTEAERDTFTERNAANRDASVSAAAISAAFTPTLEVVSAIATALVVGFGGFLAIQGEVTLGVVVAFLGYSRAFFSSVSQLSALHAETYAALAGAERVLAVIDAPIRVYDAPEAVVLGRAKGRIELISVRFSYDTGPEVLKGIDLTIEPGTTLAVCGTTGAGKSTLVGLIPRLYDPVEGSVLIDGHDLRAVNLRSLRRNLGVVLQEPFLFSGTIGENIAYGRPGATPAEIRAAADAAGLSQRIERLPKGLDTAVAERGIVLSAGERQLVAFARALIADPPILILDEPTSSVDARSEEVITSTLRRVTAGRTAVIIAHRLSTIRHADRIIVIDSGVIVEDGSYCDLLAANGPFARFHQAQFLSP